MMRFTMGAGLALFTACAAFSQTAAKTPEFEVASVKPAAPQTGNIVMRRAGGDPGMVNYQNATLTMLIARAYEVKNYQISGPDWLDSAGFDVVARVPEGIPKEQIPQMLQALLAQRFGLKLHRETKSLPVYALIVGKGGPKLTEVEPPAPPPLLGSGGPGAGPGGNVNFNVGAGGGQLPGKGTSGPGTRLMVTAQGRQMKGLMTMTGLCNALSNFMDRPVVDLTELKGTYDIDITWAPDESDRMTAKMGGMMVGPPPAPDHGAAAGDAPPQQHPAEPAADSIFTALQNRLGLKLDPRKTQAEFLVIDHVEKVPTEN